MAAVVLNWESVVEDRTMDYDLVDSLTKRLRKLDRQRRVAFAAWCLETLLIESQTYIARKGGTAGVESLHDLVDAMWARIASGRKIGREERKRLRRRIEAISVGEEDEVSEDDEDLDECALETLNCSIDAFNTLCKGSARSAALAGQCVINRIDAQVSIFTLSGVTNEGLATAIDREIERQQKMIAYLESAACLTDADRARFVSRW